MKRPIADAIRAKLFRREDPRDHVLLKVFRALIGKGT